MPRHLLFAVHLYADGMGTARYHGVHQGQPEWPPAPGRLYQALVAGAARGLSLADALLPALQWLESLPPPLIAAPRHTLGQAVSIYVPNNDADALSDPSDPQAIAGIRTAKQVQPCLFDAEVPLLYAWPLPDDAPHLPVLVAAAEQLSQLGRGVDMAWANARVLDDADLGPLLQRHRGQVHRPQPGVTGQPMLPCPTPGTLASLLQRHRAPRLRTEGTGRKARVLFTNPPKPRFASVSYAPVRRQTLYELRERGQARPWAWPLQRAAALVERIRDAAAARLQAALPDMAGAIQSCLIGKAPDGSGRVPLVQRVAIIPLPSIGSAHADQAIRRVLVQLPSTCPLTAEDLDWAFSGLDWTDPDTGELSGWLLVKASELGMQDHYAGPSRHWQSTTPVALPEAAARRRIDPTRQRQEAKPASERAQEEAHATAAVQAALRHAGIDVQATRIQVQREPWTAHGQRAEAFAGNTRFSKTRLWHVALAFDRPVDGPVVLGDGRFLGLGVMAPVQAARGDWADEGLPLGLAAEGVIALHSQPLEPAASQDALTLARALRRATLARVRDTLGLAAEAGLDRYFSGHAADGDAPDSATQRHLAFHWDAPRQRWLVLAPHRLLRRGPSTRERQHLDLLGRALDGLTTLRAGQAGRHAIERAAVPTDDPLLAPARVWRTVSPYTVTRHRRLASAHEALTADVLAECQRLALPTPRVTVLAVQTVPGRGLQGQLELAFEVAVSGPLALGRSSLLGGGLFAAAD